MAREIESILVGTSLDDLSDPVVRAGAERAERRLGAVEAMPGERSCRRWPGPGSDRISSRCCSWNGSSGPAARPRRSGFSVVVVDGFGRAEGRLLNECPR